MRTIDEEIVLEIKLVDHYKANQLEKEAEEHEKRAKWFEELKDYRDKNKMVVRIDCVNQEEFKDMAVKLAKEQYNNALDDFAKWLVEHKIVDENSMTEIIMDFNEEQLKEGGENDI